MGCYNSNANLPIQLKKSNNDPVDDEPVRSMNSSKIAKIIVKDIVVSSLNYSGIMNCPFQFYCQEFQAELVEISRIFAELIPVYNAGFDKSTFKWQIGKIDVKIRKGRYSPMFQADIGIQNKKFVTKARFQQLWDAAFTKQSQKQKFKCELKQRENARIFDLIMYHACLRFVFHDKVKIVDDAVGFETNQYLKKMKPFYQLSFLDQKRKLEQIMKNYDKNEAHIMFFQQYSEQFKTELQKTNFFFISVSQNKDTLIAASKKRFNTKKSLEQVSKYYAQKSQKWPEGSSFMVVDKYILIGPHLSSKKDKNTPQIQLLKSTLLGLKKAAVGYEIIVGGDLNSFMKPFEQFSMYPQIESQVTTVKKRTMAQCQFNKGDKQVQESKDKIISTLKIVDSSIRFINGNTASSKDQLPSDAHPFDHFVVVATLADR